MEEDHEFRFVGNKKCPSGKSLGEKIDQNSPNKFSKENPGYVLRENPKRSWRAAAPMANVNVHHHQDKLMFCRQCGKGFQSLKALCGHMACHSDRDRGLKEDDSFSWNTDDHSQSDTESRFREMMRYNKGMNIDNCSSSCSEIDQEQEELALCLMMLSRESGKWVNMSVVESSSFHSDSVVSGTKIVQSENSDSGYFMNETEKVESDVSFGGFDKVEVSLMEEVQMKNKKKKEAPLSVYNKPTTKKKKKKKKGHVCPICHKVYKSGQALGGHKRSHFLVSSEERNHHHAVSKTRNHFLDLNLPPPMEE